MKVILTEEVQNLGEAGTIKEVANGYARNFLLPRGLAKPATPGMVKVVEERRLAEARRVAKAEEENKSLATLIEEQTLHLRVKVGKQGRLYGSIGAADIANMLSQKIGQEIDRRKVNLKDNIHTTGTFEVPVRLVGKLVPKVKVIVESDAEPAQAPAAPATETQAESSELAGEVSQDKLTSNPEEA